MLDILNQDIQYLPGVGPKKRDMLQKELGISKISDLLEYYPYKYVDRSRIYTINELRSDMPFVQVKGRILGFEEFGSGPRKKRLVAHFTDGTGIADIVWFSGIKYATQQFKVNTEYIVFGNLLSMAADTSLHIPTSTRRKTCSSHRWECSPTIPPRRR